MKYISIGIIRNYKKEIFITRRSIDGNLAELWEFPGGKMEQGETPEKALHRELIEETGIQTKKVELLEVVEQHFRHRLMILYFYLVKKWKNDPYGRESQPTRWVPQSELHKYEFPPSNVSIIRKLINQ